MKNKIELTILMPCLNEAKTIGCCIKEAKRFISENDLHAEILIADNGSTDGSKKIALSCGARAIDVPDIGYGNALIAGIRAAEGEYIIMGDCDMSYDFYHINGILQKLRDGYDLVMGNRLHHIERGAMPFSHQYIGVPLLSVLARIRYHTFVHDFHCGLRGFRRDAAMTLNLHCGGMEFATELIGKFAMRGYKIAEVDVALRKDGRGEKSHLRTIPDGIRHLKYICIDSFKEENETKG